MNYRSVPPKILVTAGHGRVVAHELVSGRIVWKAMLPGATDPIYPDPSFALTRAAVAGDRVVVFGLEQRRAQGMFADPVNVHVVLALDLATGALSWRSVLYESTHLFAPGTLLVEDDVVVVSNAFTTAAYSLIDGRPLWGVNNEQIRIDPNLRSPACGVALAVEGRAVQADAIGYK